MKNTVRNLSSHVKTWPLGARGYLENLQAPTLSIAISTTVLWLSSLLVSVAEQPSTGFIPTKPEPMALATGAFVSPEPMALATGAFVSTEPMALATGELKSNSTTALDAGPYNTDGWLTFQDAPVFAIDSLDIPSKQNGVLENLTIEINQPVAKAQKIGNLDRTAAKLEEAVAMVQSQYAASIASDESDIRFAQLIVEESKIALDSYEQISARGSATDAEMRSKKLAVAQAELKVHNATQALEQAKLKARLSQVALLTARQHVESLDFISPFDGTVTAIFRQKGEWVQTGQPVARITRLDELRVDCFVPNSSIHVASLIDQPVQAVVTNPSKEADIIAGRVVRFEPEVTATGDIRVSAYVQNQRRNNQWLLLPGMTVELRIQQPSSHLASRIPPTRNPAKSGPSNNARSISPPSQRR